MIKEEYVVGFGTNVGYRLGNLKTALNILQIHAEIKKISFLKFFL